jgi:hypothetical protein
MRKQLPFEKSDVTYEGGIRVTDGRSQGNHVHCPTDGGIQGRKYRMVSSRPRDGHDDAASSIRGLPTEMFIPIL